MCCVVLGFFFFSSRRRHTRWPRDWSSDVCSSDLLSFFSFAALFGSSRFDFALDLVADFEPTLELGVFFSAAFQRLRPIQERGIRWVVLAMRQQFPRFF